LKFSCFPHFNWFCAVESNESNTPSESKNHKDLKVEDLSSYNNNADFDDIEMLSGRDILEWVPAWHATQTQNLLSA
jgi:hypothetical protein